MKAISQEGNNLLWEEMPDPNLNQDEVLIQIKATAINRADLLQRSGNYPVPSGASPRHGREGLTPDNWSRPIQRREESDGQAFVHGAAFRTTSPRTLLRQSAKLLRTLRDLRQLHGWGLSFDSL